MPLLKAGTFKLAVGWELKLVVSANLYIVRKLQVNDRSVCLIFWYLSNSIKQQILGRKCYIYGAILFTTKSKTL